MAEINVNYTTKVGIERGAETLFCREDGNFKFYDADVTGQQMKDLIYLPTQKSTIANSAGALSVINLPSEYGLLAFSLATAASNASAWLTSGVRIGQEMILMALNTNSVASIFISTSGCSVVGNMFADCSSISLHNSADSNGYIRLRCYTTDEWTIVERNGASAERSSS